MKNPRRRWLLPVLNHATSILFVAVLVVFGILSPRFLTVANVSNLLVQSSSTAVVGVGMTFVLVAGGVDLSVGSILFVAAAVAGKLALGGAGLPAVLLAIVAIGAAAGALNGLLVARVGLPAFVATLGTLHVGRGFGLWLTGTRAMNLPEGFLALGTARFAGIPLPVVAGAIVVLAGHVLLTRTPFGRRVHAIGFDPDAARKAGLDTRRILAVVYVLCGVCAAFGGILSLAQLGAVSPTFGSNREFAAIAAAVLGGTSLQGGRGAVFPGTMLGAVLVQSIENGLVILNADPYLYPLVTATIIFAAVLMDAVRGRLLARWNVRPIYVESGE